MVFNKSIKLSLLFIMIIIEEMKYNVKARIGDITPLDLITNIL